MGNRPDFRERRKRCGDEIGFFLAVLGETNEFQAVPPTTLADRPGLNNRRLHTMRRHHGIGQRQEAATAPETLPRIGNPAPLVRVPWFVRLFGLFVRLFVRRPMP